MSAREARELANDLARNGLRFDLNPTVDHADLEQSYLEYIRRMDVHARLVGLRIRTQLDREETA